MCVITAFFLLFCLFYFAFIFSYFLAFFCIIFRLFKIFLHLFLRSMCNPSCSPRLQASTGARAKPSIGRTFFIWTEPLKSQTNMLITIGWCNLKNYLYMLAIMSELNISGLIWGSFPFLKLIKKSCRQTEEEQKYCEKESKLIIYMLKCWLKLHQFMFVLFENMCLSTVSITRA